MVNPIPAKQGQDKLYPDTRYFSHRISECGHQPVYKQLLPDGEPVLLAILPSQKLHDRSPGFGWGSTGQGPAQLALVLLLDVTSNPDKSLAYYQLFKWDVVAGWKDEWTIFSGEILEWLKVQERRELGVRISKN